MGNMHSGTVVCVHEDRGFFFIHEQTGQPDIFGHAKDLVGMPFDGTLYERRVKFDVIETDKGPRAKNIQAEE
jgi:cold shock CspA family protein